MRIRRAILPIILALGLAGSALTWVGAAHVTAMHLHGHHVTVKMHLHG